jgi:hypothetical protein
MCRANLYRVHRPCSNDFARIRELNLARFPDLPWAVSIQRVLLNRSEGTSFPRKQPRQE